ncbi:MAG: hybrid sensor histidine kinase/response regulator [Rhizobium sp.]|nr:hybrid sensor histidine kinase/response regulator [Rhizobium sp.]
MPPIRVLIIDDSEDDRETLRRMLSRSSAGYQLMEADTGDEGVRLFHAFQPHCVLLDYSLPGRNGVAVLEDIRRTHPYAAAVMLTGQGSEKVAVGSMKAGAQDYFTKDTVSRDALERAISNAVGRQELAARLEQHRQSLEIFSRAMAHDLQEPLRTIRSFGGMILDSSSLSDDDRSLMGHVLKAAANMEQLIAAITRYTRLESQGDIVSDEVLMADIVRQVKDSLLNQIEAGEAVIREHGLTTVRGDGQLLVQYLQNLVSNAIRYCVSTPPVIDISMIDLEGAAELRVADNGPGIPETFRNEIFRPFKRLVGRDVEGSGLGLAICRRIAELHGATIRCEEAPGGGALFILTLPAGEPAGPG